MHLQTLVSAGDLQVARSSGANTPNIYLITGKGLRKFAGNDYQLFAERRRQPSGSHFPHELLIIEVAALLKEAARSDSALEIRWEERFAFRRYACFRKLVPDYAFLVRSPRGLRACFVEVSSGEESTARFREKLLSYQMWIETEEARSFLTGLYRQHGACDAKPRFWLLCIMHNRRIQNDDVRVYQLIQAATSLTPKMRQRVWCTTAQAISETTNLSAVTWLRLSDFETILEGSNLQKRSGFRRELAAAQRTAKRHILFQNGISQ